MKGRYTIKKGGRVIAGISVFGTVSLQSGLPYTSKKPAEEIIVRVMRKSLSKAQYLVKRFFSCN